MFTKQVFTSTLIATVFSSASIVHAATITFSPTSLTANVNDIITLDVLMDFTGDPTIGGGTDIFYDESVVSFQSFDFGTSTLGLDVQTFTNITQLPDKQFNKLEGLAFGDFIGLSGPGIVGTLTFQAIAPGDIILSMDVTTNPLGGGAFISAIDGVTEVAVTFDTAAISVSSVPVPAAIWLFGSGLLGLVGIARRKNCI